jgi:hypothetical protein
LAVSVINYQSPHHKNATARCLLLGSCMVVLFLFTAALHGGGGAPKRPLSHISDLRLTNDECLKRETRFVQASFFRAAPVLRDSSFSGALWEGRFVEPARAGLSPFSLARAFSFRPLLTQETAGYPKMTDHDIVAGGERKAPPALRRRRELPPEAPNWVLAGLAATAFWIWAPRRREGREL